MPVWESPPNAEDPKRGEHLCSSRKGGGRPGSLPKDLTKLSKTILETNHRLKHCFLQIETGEKGGLKDLGDSLKTQRRVRWLRKLKSNLEVM